MTRALLATGDPPPLPPPPPGAAPRPALARTAEAALRALFGGRTPRPPEGASTARLEALAEAARSADYFVVLGLPRTCTADEAIRAADALLVMLAGAADGRDRSDAREVVLDARDVLGDDGLREAYRRALEASPAEAAAAEEVARERP